jgi:hypothetical protein
MSDTDTSFIDKLKEQNSSNSEENLLSKIGSYLQSLILIILLIIFYFSSGGLILFLCKLAQSNILPTELKCYPYTKEQPDIKPSPLQANIFTNSDMSMKMEIPYDINSKNSFIEILRQQKEKPSSNFLTNYFISITDSLFKFVYSGINSSMSIINKTIPEAAIIGLGPIGIGFLYAFGLLINTFYFIYLWFSNMYWFFKTNKNDTNTGKPEWEDITFTSPVNWSLGFLLIIAFTILLFIGFPLISSLPFIVYHIGIISSLFYRAKMNGKEITSLNIIIDTLKYYKIHVVSIISIFVVMLSFSKLGTIPGIFSIITIILIYYGVIGIGIYDPIHETNLSPLTSYEQAKKICVNQGIKSNKHGLLYNLLIGQKGGDITKQIKKIGKYL